MAARRRLAGAAALAVVLLDLADKAVQPAGYHHPRAARDLALMGLVALAILLVVPRVESTALALAGGVAAGGAIANLLSGALWGAGVPDPLVHGGYAFNLADIAAVLGDAGLLTAACVVAWDNRHRLRAPA